MVCVTSRAQKFDVHADVKQFEALVEVHGHAWPPAEILIAKGLASLVPGAFVTPAPPAMEGPPPVLTFEAFALLYLERLVKPNPEARRKYLERLRVHVFPDRGASDRGDHPAGDAPVAGRVAGQGVIAEGDPEHPR